MSFKNCIEFMLIYDLFAFVPRYRKFSTKLGLLLTIFFILTIILASIYFFDNLTNKRFPETSITISNNYLDQKKIDFNFIKNPFFFSFYDQTINYNIENILEIYVYQISTKNEKLNITDTVKLEKCTEEHFKVTKKNLDINPFVKKEYLYCLPLNKNYSIYGYYENPNFYWIGFHIKKCNKKLNKNCFSEEEINQKFKYLSLWITFLDNDVDLNNYKNPIKQFWRNEEIFISFNFSKKVSVIFDSNNIRTDDGTVLENITEDSYISYSSLDQKLKNILNNETIEPLIEGFILYNSKNSKINRRYLKLLDVLGQIGGISSLIFSFLNLFVSKYSEITYFVTILKKSFILKTVDDKNLKPLQNVNIEFIEPKEIKTENEIIFDDLNKKKEKDIINKKKEKKRKKKNTYNSNNNFKLSMKEIFYLYLNILNSKN